VSAIENRIDELYRAPLQEFTAARNALAKSLSGDEAKRVRALAKPTVVPWAINQVYWHARRAYDALMKSGERLRKAQLAALAGKKADLREAGDVHRRAIADAAREAERLAGAAGSRPSPDVLTRTLEALSLASEPPEAPGRLTRELQPAGFEALAGVTPTVRLKPETTSQTTVRLQPDPRRHHADKPSEAALKEQIAAAAQKRAREEEAALRKQEAAQRRRDAAVKKAEAEVERARRKMEAAEAALREVRGRG